LLIEILKAGVDLANKAYKFRIYPNAEQQVLFAKTFGCCRLVYNYYLDRRISEYNTNKTVITCAMCSKELSDLKKTDDFVFLQEVDSIALQQSLRHLDSAFQNFFKRSKSGFPKFKSKNNNKHSYSTVRVDNNIFIKDNCLKLPKIGFVKMKLHRQIPDDYKLKSVTISKSASNKYYASILFEYENQVIQKDLHDFIGLDFSMKELYIDSNGNEPCYPRYYRESEKRLKREQRKLSRMQKGSANRYKQKLRIAKLHEKIANQRKDFLHKQSRYISDNYDCVCIEDLDMRAMSQSLNFGKSVMDNGWGMFITFLKYKLEEQGKKLVKIDKYFASSQLCSVCNYKNPDVKNLSIRQWDCPICKTHHDRDVNAAVNIRNEGMRLVTA
jgi:putative transposase